MKIQTIAMKHIDLTRKVRGSSLPELLVAMILAGLVLFSAYEGLTLLQRRLGSTSHASASWQLIQADAVVERLMRQADSIIHSDSELLFYSSGVCSDTLAADGKSIEYRNGTSDDVLFTDATWAVTGYAGDSRSLVKRLDIFLPYPADDTLRLTYVAGSSEYIKALHDF